MVVAPLTQPVVMGTQPVSVVRPVTTVATSSPGPAGAGFAVVDGTGRVVGALEGVGVGVGDGAGAAFGVVATADDVPAPAPAGRPLERGAVVAGDELRVAAAGGVTVITISGRIRPFASGTRATARPLTVLTGAVTVVTVGSPSKPVDWTMATLSGVGSEPAAGPDPL